MNPCSQEDEKKEVIFRIRSGFFKIVEQFQLTNAILIENCKIRFSFKKHKNDDVE